MHFYLHVSGGAKYSVWNDIQLKELMYAWYVNIVQRTPALPHKH